MGRALMLSCTGICLVGLAVAIAAPAQAMPEYAARTGQPCASCHAGTAGGGLRNLRGQAWVTIEKPDTVPGTTESLEILGIRLASDPSIYVAGPAAVPSPAPLNTRLGQTAPLIQELLNHAGN